MPMNMPINSHGKVMYLLMPCRDPEQSATFYRDVFGWTIRDSDEGLAFHDGAGSMAGRWVTDSAPADDPGFLLFIMVADIEKTKRTIELHGGTIVDVGDPEAFDVLLRFRDPGGNLLGVYQMKPGDPG